MRIFISVNQACSIFHSKGSVRSKESVVCKFVELQLPALVTKVEAGLFSGFEGRGSLHIQGVHHLNVWTEDIGCKSSDTIDFVQGIALWHHVVMLLEGHYLTAK